MHFHTRIHTCAGVYPEWPALSEWHEGAPHGQEQVLRSRECLPLTTGGGETSIRNRPHFEQFGLCACYLSTDFPSLDVHTVLATCQWLVVTYQHFGNWPIPVYVNKSLKVISLFSSSDPVLHFIVKLVTSYPSSKPWIMCL